MRYELRYLPSFVEDYWETLYYISYKLYAPQAARRLLDRADTIIAKLAENPKLGRKYITLNGNETPYRRLIVRNHIVFYRIDEDAQEVRVHRIVYGGRDLDRIVGELPRDE